MQVDIMVWFQGLFENFNGFFDFFWLFITSFGEEIILFIALPLLYWSVNKEVAELVAFTGFTSLIVNGALKDIAQIERPIGNEMIRFVDIDNFFVNTANLKEGSYSFPSGHAQSISAGLFTLSLYYKKRKLWIWSVVIVLLVMLSRMYLGVHWPLDVVIGAMVGFVCAYFGYHIFIKFNNDKRVYLYFGLIVLSLLALIVAQKSDTFKAIGSAFGLAFGVLFERKFVDFNPKEGTLIKKIIRVILGLVIVFGIKEGSKLLFGLIGDYFILDALRYAILIFVAMAIYPYFFKKVKL